jgi:hypothetical protein
MKHHFLFALLLAFAVCGAANGQRTTTYHAKGAFAQSNFTNISLSVYTGDESYNGQNFLIYSTFQENPDGSYSFGSGDGFIPNSAFIANNVEQMSLNVDTSQVSGFNASTCVVQFEPSYTYTCTAGPYGVIQVNWQANGNSSSSTKSNFQGTEGPYSIHTIDDSDYSSANATGTFLGTSVTDYGSEIGTSHGSQVSITSPN